jgi:hypothetical protein
MDRAVLSRSPHLRNVSRLDLAILKLVRLVLADDWQADAAGERLRLHVGEDQQVLRLLRARVARTMLKRPSALGARATATLAHALPPHASAPGPSQRRGYAHDTEPTVSGPVGPRLWISGCGPGLGGRSEVAHWSRQVGLHAATSSTGRAREFVGLHLKGRELSGLVDDVQLVVSELATNAVLHAGTAFTVSLWCDGAPVLLTVTDDSPLLPRCGEPSEVAIGGRGLTVVQAMSHDWGVTEGAPGKAVWALFHTAQGLDHRSGQRMDPVPEGDPHGVETASLRG